MYIYIYILERVMNFARTWCSLRVWDLESLTPSDVRDEEWTLKRYLTMDALKKAVVKPNPQHSGR